MKTKQTPKYTLRELIEQSGYRVDWLATEVGIKTRTLHGYINGDRNPSPTVLKLLAIKLKVEETDILLNAAS